MSGLRVLVLGDGKHELGPGPKAVPREVPAALPRLVERMLGEPAGAIYVSRPFKGATPMHGTGFVKKTQSAIRQARTEGFDAVVILVDRDRNPDRDRLGALCEGRDAMRFGQFPRCAVGAAIETFDAWMIVDGKAVGAVGGDSANTHPDPETLDGKERTDRHPKDRAKEIFGEEDGLSGKYAVVAGCIDLTLLAKCCPKGFGRFAEDVKTNLGPLVAAK